MAAVDVAGAAIEFALEPLILCDILARAGCHLEIVHLKPMLGKAVEQAAAEMVNPFPL